MNKPKPRTITGEAYPDLLEYFKPLQIPTAPPTDAYVIASEAAIRKEQKGARELLAHRAKLLRESTEKHAAAVERLADADEVADCLIELLDVYQRECDECDDLATTAMHEDDGSISAVFCDGCAEQAQEHCRIEAQDPPTFPHDQPADALDDDDTRPGCDA